MSEQEKRKTKGTPDEMDVHVGQRLRIRRSLLGISQEKLAEAVGITFQQIQKYERGTNRISASRLFKFGNFLGVDVNYFYKDFPGSLKNMAVPALGLSDNAQSPLSPEGGDIMQEKETIDLVKAYYSIHDEDARKDILKFIRSMSERFASK